MKIKSLLFAALVAGMSFAANAENAYTDCGDQVTAQDLTLEPGAQATVKLNVTRLTSPDFTNLQFDLVFPEGVAPKANAKGKYTALGADAKDEDGESILSFSENSAKFENRTVTYVAANMTKTAITANPANVLNIYVAAAEDAKGGEVELIAKNLKYTCYNNDSYATAAEQVVCTINIPGSTGVNDINVNAVKTYKTIENGQVIIVKGETRYNTMGQIVK